MVRPFDIAHLCLTITAYRLMLIASMLSDDNSYCSWGCKKGGQDIEGLDRTQQFSALLWCVRRSWQCLYSDGVSGKYKAA